MQESVSVVILGASGNLALTKLLPSLYTLFTSGTLPQQVRIVGYARTEMSEEAFRADVEKHLPGNVEETTLVPAVIKAFLNRITYVAGQYDSTADFIKLREHLEIHAGEDRSARTLFYLSIPPAVFPAVIDSLRESKLVIKGDKRHAVVVEKPFGYDTQTARELNDTISGTFAESQVFRIDHYLGKEAIQNLLVMRFANIIFEPVWNCNYIESVTVSWEEDKAIGSRGGYFEQAGIIRDVIQNHLLQILALVAMEQPTSLTSESICVEKCKVLKAFSPFKIEDITLGQYTEGVCAGKPVRAYRNEPGVPAESKRETFASIRCGINNARWSGVPFILRAGKALTKSSTEIIIQFRDVPGDIFRSPHHPNKLVIRVQPDAGVVFHITNKVPGKGMVLKDVKMNFTYTSGFTMSMPGAYERLLLDAILGDKTLFISYEELIQSWELFTPMLKKIDKGELDIHFYPGGTHGPESKH